VSQVTQTTRNPITRLSLVLAFALCGALLLAMFASTASAQGQPTIGRGFTGLAKVGDDGLTLNVKSKGLEFAVFVTDFTVVNIPPDENLSLSDLPIGTEFKIAGLVSGAITDADGLLTLEPLNALKITVIPERATRKHKRTIAAEKEGDNVTALGEDGSKTELTGRGAGIEKGEAIIMLVQSSDREGIGEKVRGLFRAKIVDERLDRLSNAEISDPFKIGDLSDLRKKREDVHEKRLQMMAATSDTGFREFVLETARTFQVDTEERRSRSGVGKIVSECARKIAGDRAKSIDDLGTDERKKVTDECLDPKKIEEAQTPVVRITSPALGSVVAASDVVTVTAEAKDDEGVVSVTFNFLGVDIATLTEASYSVEITIPTGVSSVAIKATALDKDGRVGSHDITLRVAHATDVGVKITSPRESAVVTTTANGSSRRSTVSGSSESIAEGDTINIRAEVAGTGTITVVFAIAGVAQTPISAPPYAMTYFVPRTNPAATTDTPPALSITSVATDASGNTASDAVSVTIIRKTTTVNVKITEPQSNAKISGGDTVVIKATTDDDSEIAFATFSVGGVETVDKSKPFTHTYVTPRRASNAAATSGVPPNVFVGKATLDGKTAPDDTVIIAWIAGSDSTTLIIKVTATANGGETGSASMSLPVSSSLNAGEAKVKDGEYVLTAAQPSGQSFNGKTVAFTVGGKDARQTATWQQGGADIVNLTAN